jgi:hypothetical protein
MGKMKLIRKTNDKRKRIFDPTQVGEFTFEQIREFEPNFNPADLELDVTSMVAKKPASGEMDPVMLAACLSFVMTREHLVMKNEPRS